MAKIVHLITGLGNGGAEGVLVRLCLNDFEHTHVVVSMMGKGNYGDLLENRRLTVVGLGMSRSSFSLRGALEFLSLLRNQKPDVLQTWMPHADLLGGIVGRLAGVPRIFWNIRHGTYDRKLSNVRTRLIVYLLACLSWAVPSKIVVCAISARKEHARIGFRSSKMIVISNGFELAAGAPSSREDRDRPGSTGPGGHSRVVGMLARFDPQKDHRNFLRALALVRSSNATVTGVLAGPGIDKDNPYLAQLILEMGLSGSVALLGPQQDVPKFMRGISIHVLSSSFGEGFPNVVAEAMLYEVPCISTDVGDARRIIGNTGWVVPPSDSPSLATALSSALSLTDSQLRQLGRKARERIQEEFSLKKMVDQYASLYRSASVESS